MTVMSNFMGSGKEEQVNEPLASSVSGTKNQKLYSMLRESLSETVEISALQQRILTSVAQGVAMDGLHYRHETLDLDIRVGKQSTHSCGYRLVFTDEYLGEITFKRNRRFSEREMQFIESLIPALFNPLRKSLISEHGN
jgi:hypothetical protein